MEWIRHHPKASAIAAALATVLVIVGLWALVNPSDPEPATLGDPDPVFPSPSTLSELPSASPSPTATPTKKGGGSALQGLTAGGLGSSGSGGGAAQGGTFDMQGLTGGSLYQYAPRHALLLRVSSEQPIETLGYFIPTSVEHRTGTLKHVGKSWSLRATVYGDPDYSRIYIQGGALGYPITCTITVDGKVVEQRTTEGPYARLICQG